MDDSWQLRAASARSSSQHFPISVGSRNQIDMNFGQISHPYVAQEVCVIERTIRQEPVQPSTVNYGYSGSTSKMSRPELGNSFLALLSGPSQQFRSEYQQSSSARSAVLAGNSPFFQIGALENGSWPPLTASDVPAAPQTCGNGGFGCGLELSHIGVSRELLPSGFNRVTAFHDNFDSGNLRPNMSDVFKHGNRPSVHDSEAELQASVPQWLTDAANLRQQQLQSMQSARLLKTLAGTGYAEVEQPSSVMKARPRVYCVGTSGMLSGELVLSVTGHLGVLCSCHNQHMPVAKFSEHAGQASGNPGTVVHMENGETIVMWRKAFFSQFGVKVPDDEKGWDWNDGNSSEAGSVKCKTASSQNMDKNNIPSYQTDHSTAKSKNAHFFNSSVYRNNSYESHVAQGLSTGGFLPSAAQKNVHEVRDALFKNFSRVCKGDTPVQRNPQPLERLKDNLSRVPDMSYRGSPNYVNTSVAEYIDFINNGGQAFISSQSPAGIKNFQKGFILNNLSNIQESVPQKKDAISSGFELRLGQPSQQPHTLGGPLPASLDSQVSNADIDRQKSLFLERMLKRVCGPSVAEGTQQNGTCNLPGFLGNKEKGKGRHFDNQAQAVGRTNMLQSGCIDHLKYDSAKGSNVSMYLHPGGHPNGPIEEVLMPIMNKVVGDPEQLVNKLMQMNANSHVIKHDIPEGVRNKVMGIPNKGYTQSMEYGYNSSQTKLDMTSGPSVPCDMYGNLASLIQAKQRIDNRLLHDIIPGHCLPPDISMHGKQSLLSEIQKTAVSPIEPDIRNGPNQMAVNSNLGISDHPDAFWLRAINSALSKNSGPALLSAAAQLNIPRTAVAATLSRMADNAENKVNVDACQMQRMSEEHLRSMLGLMGGTHVCKRSEMASSSSNQEPKSDISREQVQLAGLFGSAVVPVQKSFNQDGLGTNISDSIQGMCHRDKQGIGNAFENPAGRHHVRIDQESLSPHENPDFLGPNSSRSNAPPSEDRNAKISQTKDAFGQQPGCILPTSNDKPLPSLTRHSQKCLDTLAGVLSATKQKDSDRVIVSEKDHPGELESPESKELSRTDPHIAVSKENAMSAALGTNSAVVVSVGENDSGTEKECAGENKNVEGHAIMNTGCESFHSMQDNGKAMADVAVMQDGSPEDLTNSRGTVEDHLADTAAKSSKKVLVDTGSPKKEEQMSNVCSKISDNVFSEFSDAGHVINDDVCNVDSGGKKLMRSDVVDEGSGIGKCCSSDAVDTGVWTRRKLASVNGDKKALVASSLLPNPTSTTDNGVSKVRSSLRLKRVHKSMATIVAETEHPLQTVGRTGKLEKKRRTMKWKRLDDAVRISEDNSKLSVPLSYVRKIDSIFVPSDTVGKSYEVQCGTASVSSTPTKICTLKRKRSALVSGNPLTSNCKSQGFQEDRRKVEPVQQVQFKGDKLVIRIRQTSVERKAKKNGADGIDSDFDRTISRKVSSYDAMGSGKTPLFRHNDITLPEDKKLTQRRSSSALRNGIRTGQGKPTLKPAKMASLSSILKHSESHVDTSCKGGGKQTVTGFKNSPLEKDEGKSGKLTVLQRRHLNELRESSDYTVEPNRRRDGKELTGLVNVKETRKRSLWELTGKHKHENKSSHYPGPGTTAQSKNKCQLDLSNAIGGEFSNNHCPFPRGERTLRLRFKCKSKGNFGKPNLTASTGTSHWFSANHHTTPNILLHSDGVRKSKMYTPDSGFESLFMSVVKDDHNVSKCEISPIEEPLSYFTKTNTRKDLNSITLNKKETEDINKPTSGVFKKQKQVKKDEKIQVNIGECREMMGVSCAPKSVCQTIKTKRRSNDGIYGENNGSNSLPKRRRMEDAAHVSNFEADGCCCVCGDLNEQSNNHLVQCGGCLIKVHQACYGVSKLPKSSWTCRACKSNLSNIVCVLCGYGGGAMTRAQKARNVVKNLLPVWQVTRESNSKALAGGLGLACKGNALNEANSKPIPGMSGSIKSELGASRNRIPNLLSFGKQDNNKTCPRGNLEDVVQMGSTQTGKVQNLLNSEFRVHNSITAAVNDPSVTQWVHMVCGLWMPGTRCLNNSTMGVFDVSGATIPRRKVVCSICNRPGGLCIQCRVIKCSVPFHAWCAHQKGLLQSEIEGDHGEKVGFYGRCILHAQGAANDVKEFESRDNLDSNLQSESGEGTCARTEGYKGRKSWEESMAELRRHSDVDSTRVVSQEQINAWLHINGRKSCTRGIIKPPNTDVKADYRREYLRFKQEQRWKRLVVYKSGIHALGLYTAEFISKGEMVVEYVGEIVGLRVADKREANYLNSGGKMQYEGACYFFRIDKESIIDATRKGGIARFVNHSCSPNCVAKVISVRTQKKVVFFAERDINAGEEITYDYHFNHEDDGKKIPCFCNSRNCRRYLN